MFAIFPKFDRAHVVEIHLMEGPLHQHSFNNMVVDGPMLQGATASATMILLSIVIVPNPARDTLI